MCILNFPAQLKKQLRYIETSAREYDDGNEEEAIRIATSLRTIFHQTRNSTSLLSHLKSNYTNIFTSIQKKPYPTGTWTPLVGAHLNLDFPDNYSVDPGPAQPLKINSPVYKPLLDNIKTSRFVPAPDWWNNEPAFLLQNSKITRRDIILWAANKDGGTHVDTKFPKLYERLQTDVIGFKLHTSKGELFDFSCKNAHYAALRHMAYEIMKSSKLLEIANH